jgi:hypothetical protein
MSKPPNGKIPEPNSVAKNNTQSFLGLQTQDLAGLSVDELVNNKTAITMVVHYYKQLVDENASLRNDLNTAQTYIPGYEAKRVYSRVGSGLQFVGTVLIAFGVNLLTGVPTPAGWLVFVAGIICQGIGLYYSWKDIS